VIAAGGGGSADCGGHAACGGNVGCGGAGGTCCGAGGAGCGGGCGGGYDDTTVLSYVGTGQGEYIAETSYKYVGKGAGDIQMVEVPTKVAAGWGKWLIVIPLILAILWLLFPYLSSDTTTTTIPDHTIHTCLVYGDPHVLSFDKAHADYYSEGEYWLVKSDTVWIQARYHPTPVTHGLAVTKEIAIGGPFLKGHTLFFNAQSTSMWGTGKMAPVPILTSFPSSFHNVDPFVDIHYNAQGKVLQKGRAGKALHVLHITLPLGVKIQVNRWNEPGEDSYINVKIVMPPQPDQHGHCNDRKPTDASAEKYGKTCAPLRPPWRRWYGVRGCVKMSSLFALS